MNSSLKLLFKWCFFGFEYKRSSHFLEKGRLKSTHNQIAMQNFDADQMSLSPIWKEVLVLINLMRVAIDGSDRKEMKR